MSTSLLHVNPKGDYPFMAIKKEDWPQIDGRIQLALVGIADELKSLRPRGWRKAVFHLRELGPLVTIIAVFVALLAITLGAIYQAFSHVKEETEFRTNTKNKLDKLDTDVVSLRALTSSNQPLKIQNQKAAKELLAQARQKLVPPIPEDVVHQAGMSFLEASETDANSWKVALDFLSYRSSLNPDLTPPASQLVLPQQIDYMFQLGTKPNPNSPRINYPGSSAIWVAQVAKAGVPTTKENSARLESLSNPSPGNLRVSLIVVEGKSDIIVLDGEWMKNVIIKNATVEYDGGPTRLENVSFVNCTFILKMSQKTRDLGQTILASNPITFTSS